MPACDQEIDYKRYMLIPRNLIFITRGSDVLLIRGALTKRLWAGRYNGIGGHMERGEDVKSSAQRELYEETGLKVHIWLCGIITIDMSETLGIIIFVFRGEYREGELTGSSEGSLEWISSENIENIPTVEDLPLLLPKVLHANENEGLFSARYTYSQSGDLIACFN
jgi:8-oxo-dGTP diphosphatase